VAKAELQDTVRRRNGAGAVQVDLSRQHPGP
jgi:hypothetical protein